MIVCEPVCVGQQHASFNARFISEIVKVIDHDERLFFYCESNHWLEVERLLPAKVARKIVHASIKEFPKPIGLSVWIHRLQFLVKMNALSKKKESWLFLSPDPILFWITCFWFRKKNPTFVLHALLSKIDGWVSRNPITRIFSVRGYFLNKYICRPKMIVLEERIMAKLLSLNSSLESSLLLCPHFLPLDDVPNSKQSNSNNIVFPGLFSLDKGRLYFEEVARECKKDARLSFQVAGQCLEKELCNSFDSGPFESKIDRKDYVRMIAKAKYLFVVYDEAYYKWTASGVYLDAVHFRKPIISFKNSITEQITAGKFDIGYFVESPQELLQVVKKISEGKDASDYEVFLNRLSQLKRKRKQESEAGFKDFKKAL